MDFKNAKAKDIMSKKPFSVEKDFFASQALFIMNENNITQIFVVKDNKPVGIIHMHDLVRAGIV